MTSASERMRLQAVRDTTPEVELRRALHARGLRYRIHERPLTELRRTADIVFRSRSVAVFVDGCFWHACPKHGTQPKTNAVWWARKLSGNVSRDRETDQLLREAGWNVVRVWEHEDAGSAAERVVRALATTGAPPS